MEPSSYSGAGGKIRRRPTPAAAATPYDRPPAAAAAHRLAAAAAAVGGGYAGPGGEGGGWVSRLVEPASRLIAGGAARLFSTVFRKRLAPPSSSATLEARVSAPPGSDAEPKENLPESAHTGLTPVRKSGLEKGKNLAGTSDDKALSEVEHLLMRKTFTRVEFDRLTDLLRARTVESDFSTQVDNRKDENKARTRIDDVGGSTSHGVAVDHPPAADNPVCGVSSPADLAKQYMSGRYSREPQSSSLRSRVFLSNKAEARNTDYDRRSGVPLVQERNEFGNENSVLPVNGYVTSGLRGRSAICRMSRSPFFKGPSTSSDMNVSPFSSSHGAGRQVLKRRGNEFENELGSVGPIRRIRQKTNMMSPFRDDRVGPRGNFLSSRTIGSDFTDGSSSHQESPSSKGLLLGTGQSLRTDTQKNGEHGKSSSDNVPPVSPQSNKTAEKIFEQLNIIAPSPKEKQSGKQAVVGNTGQSMSKQSVWQDNGPNSVNDPSSSQKFQDFGGANRPHDKDLNGSPLNKNKLTKDGSSKVSPCAFQDSGNKRLQSDHVPLSEKPAIFGNSASPTTSQKPGFKMAVFEDLYEFDDDQETPIQSKNSSIEKEAKTIGQKIDSKIKEQTVQPNIFKSKVKSDLSKEKINSSPVGEHPITSSPKDVSSSGLFSFKDSEKNTTLHVSADNNTGFTFPHVPPGDHPESTVSALPCAPNKDDKQTSASSLMFGLKPSRTPDLETSATAGVNAEGILGESVTKPTTERGSGRERAGDINKSSDKVLPSAAPTLTPPLHFPSTVSTSPSLSNGFSHSSSPKLSNDMPSDKPTSSLVSSTTSTTFAVSSSSPPISSSFPALPTMNFGSSTSMVAAAKSDSTIPETKPASTVSFGTMGTTEAKTMASEPASKISSNLNTVSNFSSQVTTFSSSPVISTSSFLSSATFSSSPVSSSRDGIASTNSALSTTLSTAPVIQSAATTPFTSSSSGNSIFGLNSPAQPTGLSTSIAASTSQPSAAGTVFGSKLPQPQGTMSQPSQTSAIQFSSSFPTVATGTGPSSSGPGTVSFGAGASSGTGTLLFGSGASSSGMGTVSFGAGASSSGMGTVSFGAGASSSGMGTVSFGAGASSSGMGNVSFGAGASSSGPGNVSFGSGVSSSGPGTLLFGAGASSSGPGSVSFGAGASSSGPGTLLFGAGAASSGPGTVSFGAVASAAGPGTVSFGATTSSSGSGFGNSPFGSGAAFSGSGFAFSSPSSSAGSSLTVASTSIFSSSSSASSSAAFSNQFGSSSSPPSMFTFGQSASSGSGFSFGAQSAPAFSSQAPVFSFTSANTSVNSSTPLPTFGLTNASTAFNMGSPGNDQMNMEDSMADDTNQAAPTQVPAPVFGSPFGQPGSSPAAPLFGAPAVQPAGVFQFGGQQGSAQQNPSFPLGGSVSGNFSLGSGGGGGDKSSRRVVKVKRTQKKR